MKEQGSTELTATLNTPSLSLKPSSDNDFSFEFNNNNNYTVNATDSSGKAKWQYWLSAAPGINDQLASKVTSNLPSLSFDFGSLNYFAVSNILFNTGVFTADTNAGLNIPSDGLIVGNIDS